MTNLFNYFKEGKQGSCLNHLFKDKRYSNLLPYIQRLVQWLSMA